MFSLVNLLSGLEWWGMESGRLSGSSVCSQVGSLPRGDLRRPQAFANCSICRLATSPAWRSLSRRCLSLFSFSDVMISQAIPLLQARGGRQGAMGGPGLSQRKPAASVYQASANASLSLGRAACATFSPAAIKVVTQERGEAAELLARGLPARVRAAP